MKAGYQMATTCELYGSVESLVIDHIIPLVQDSSNELDNLRTLCNSCNTKEAWKWKERTEAEKYTTHLRLDTIKAIKRWALDHEMKDYEVAQDAFDQFFQAHAYDEQ
jgi:HNH endonuclease